MRHLTLPATILALLTAVFGLGGAVAEGNVKDLVAPAKSPTHFAGVPPQGTRPSTPTTGKLLLSFVRTIPYVGWNVYEDGRVIGQKWDSAGDPTVIPRGARMIDTSYVQQRLSPQGVQLLRARILSTGLFERDLRLRIPKWIQYQARRGDHMVTFTGSPQVASGHELLVKVPTPAQARGLAQIKALLADTAAWSLPTTAWADREVRAFAPSHYVFAYDRGPPDLTKLPSPLLPYKKLFSHGGPNTCKIVTTGYLRAILQAFREAGIAPASNHAEWLAFALKGPHGHPSGPHFSPILPSDSPCRP
jgi:hypothetical protein